MPFGALEISATLELRRANEKFKMIVACTQSKETEDIVLEDWDKRQNQRKYKVRDIDYRQSWTDRKMYFVTEWCFDIESQSFNQTYEDEKYYYSYGIGYISLVTDHQDTLLICGLKWGYHIDLATWEMRKQIYANQDFLPQIIKNTHKEACYPLISGHVVPDTDLGFMIELCDTQSIKLFSLETGQRYVLVNSSIGSPLNIQ